MEWTPGGMSDDVEDRRGESGGGGGFGFGGGGGIGIVGFVILLVISLITGRNYIGAFFSGGGGAPVQQSRSYNEGPVQESASEHRSAQLVSYVLDDAQKTWTTILPEQAGKQYRHARLVLFRGVTYSGCGNAEESTGPFYCPADEKVYIDLDFWNELKRIGGDAGDFAQAYVIAHELGHHVQNILGTEARVRQGMQANRSQQNALSVRMELQADCYAGVWGHETRDRSKLNDADLEDALKAAAAVGDDHLQKMAGRAVSPESWTHGSSAQRIAWFKRGFESGQISQCNTFGLN